MKHSEDDVISAAISLFKDLEVKPVNYDSGYDGYDVSKLGLASSTGSKKLKPADIEKLGDES